MAVCGSEGYRIRNGSSLGLDSMRTVDECERGRLGGGEVWKRRRSVRCRRAVMSVSRKDEEMERWKERRRGEVISSRGSWVVCTDTVMIVEVLT